MPVDEEIEEGRRRHSALGLLVSLGVLVVIVAGTLVFAKMHSSGLNYTLTFTDAKGLRAGDPVILSGVQVGEVRRVELVGENDIRVAVHIASEHAPKIKQDSTAVITSVSFPNVSGQKVVEIHNPSNVAAVALAKDSVVPGKNGTVDFKAWQIQQKLGTLGKGISEQSRAVADKVSYMVEEMKDLPESPEVKEALKKLDGMTEDLKTRSKDKMTELGKRWDDFSKQYGPEIEVLKQKGKQKAAEAMQTARDKFSAATQRAKSEYNELTSRPAR